MKHTHLIGVSMLEGETIFVPAGAVFTTRNAPLSYNYASLDAESGTGTVFFRRYSDTRREWIKDLDSTGDDADGKWPFTTHPMQQTSKPTTEVTPRLLVSEDEEEGFIDWAIRMLDAGDALTELMQRINISTETATNKTEILAQRLRNTGGDLRIAHSLILQMAANIEEFADDIDEVAGEMATEWQAFYQSFSPFLSLESDDLRRWLAMSEDRESHAEKMIEVIATVETVTRQIDGLWVSVSESRMTITQLRGAHRSLNKAVRKIDRALGHFLDVLDQIRSDLTNMATLPRSLPATLTGLIPEAEQVTDLIWEVVFDENDPSRQLYWIDEEGIGHMVEDQEIARFMASRKGSIALSPDQFERITIHSPVSVSKDSFCRIKGDYFLVFDDKAFWISSISPIYQYWDDPKEVPEIEVERFRRYKAVR